MNENALSIDVGTSSMKGAIIGRSGKMLAWAREGLLDRPGADLDNWDVGIWLSALKKIIIKLRKSGENFKRIVISGNGPTVVPASTNETGKAILWLDKRSKRQNASYYLHKIKWLMDNAPKQYQAAKYFLGCAEFLNYYLTGNAAMISPWEEFDKYIWTSEEIDSAGIDRDKLPPIVRGGELIGRTNRFANDFFALPPGTGVYASGSDFFASLIGTAAIKPGRTCDRAGTSEGINYCNQSFFASDLLRPLPHAIKGLYNIAGILESTGRIFEWFRSITTQKDVSYEQMLKEICGLPFATNIPDFFPSTHVGEVWQFSNAVFSGLQPRHTEVEMGRAVIEAIGFAVLDLLDTLEKADCHADSLRISGGQGRNVYWNQMKADITGREILVPEIIDAELLGNYCIVEAGLGRFGSISEAAESLVKINKTYRPRKEENKIFSERFQRYRGKCDELLRHYN